MFNVTFREDDIVGTSIDNDDVRGPVARHGSLPW